MIAPEDILDKKFEKGRGYDKKEVDDYLQELYEAFQEMYRKNVEYQDQIQSLNSGLQHYKTIETSLQKALILAEKTADETIQTARLKAESIIREAENRAAMYTADSRAELEAVHGKTIGLMQEYVRYKAQFNKLIQEQIELLNGSRFDIQTDDLLAFQKLNEESNAKDLADTQPLPQGETEDTDEIPTPEQLVAAASADIAAGRINFGDVQEQDTNYESAIPDTPSSVEVYPGYKVSDSMNSLDYLNAAERINEEAFKDAEQEN
jgi:cell division initiation protein